MSIKTKGTLSSDLTSILTNGGLLTAVEDRGMRQDFIDSLACLLGVNAFVGNQGITGTLTVSAGITPTDLTASKVVLTDGSKKLISSAYSEADILNLWEVGSGTGSLQTKSAGDASGDNSLSILNSFAGGDSAVAIGIDSYASGTASIAIGDDSLSDADYTIAIGENSTADQDSAVAIGDGADATGIQSIAIGMAPSAEAEDSVAIGTSAVASAIEAHAFGGSATGLSSTSIGLSAVARIAKTTNIRGPIITRKDFSISDNFLDLAGAEVTLTTVEIDLKTVNTSGVGDFLITIPTGCKFYPNEVQLIITTLGGTFTGQPTIEAGKTGSAAFLLGAVATTGLAAAFDRQRFQTLLVSNGQQTLTAGVTAAATGSSTIKGRFVFKGLLIEDE